MIGHGRGRGRCGVCEGATTRARHQPLLSFLYLSVLALVSKTHWEIATQMSNGNDGESGKKSMRAWASAKVRNIGQRLSIPKPKRRSRSPSPAPSSSSGRKPQPEGSVTPYPQAMPTAKTTPIAGPRALGHTFASSATASPTGTGPATPPVSSATTGQPAATPLTLAQTLPTHAALPQILSPLEIRQLTADLLKKRLTPEEVEEIRWDGTTEEQAKAVVEEVQKSLEGKPEHTGKMYKTLQYINQYSKIIDVAIQHQPCITALVWAGVRTVIQVCGHSLFVNLYPSVAARPPNVARSVNAQVDGLHMELGFVYFGYFLLIAWADNLPGCLEPI